MESPLITKLQQKKMFLLHEHLEQSILSGKVQSIYRPLPPKSDQESEEEFLQRVRKEASEYQFVSVMSGEKIFYVCFGTPGPVITEYGTFVTVPAEVVGGAWGMHHLLFYPDLKSLLLTEQPIMLRIDSGCFSGMVLGDQTCDCLKQLRKSQKLCVHEKMGLIIEIPGHDGRGWGEYKMANQRIMHELGYDTIKTAELFYGSKEHIDVRTYDEAIIILKALGLGDRSFKLGTSNPYKISAFKKFNIKLASANSIYADKQPIEVLKNLEAKLKFWQQSKEEN